MFVHQESPHFSDNSNNLSPLKDKKQPLSLPSQRRFLVLIIVNFISFLIMIFMVEFLFTILYHVF